MDYYQSERIANAIKGIASVNEQSMLTKREHFAAMAMQGMITAITKFRDDAKEIIVNRPKDIAELSCLYADTLIDELNKEQSK